MNEPSFTVAYLDGVTLITFSRRGLPEAAEIARSEKIDEMFHGVFARLSQPLVIDISTILYTAGNELGLIAQILIPLYNLGIAGSIVCSKPVEEVLQVTRMDQFVQIFPTVPEAIRALTGQ